ncbi:interferon-inducible double-stranded RNA-dependent protein kinase activator A [Aphis craccivora]|uniref:Interferon-inducible double-stranded RNA-dependent protein kinase activator A n=1 Tax=Aphis craccivora TaxID=307492 RepID=A0A6G0Y363_APHCR|nr:interferon-inducible double-stranded RNA-dependent protein kinase activator A [Aphis craccivora]
MAKHSKSANTICYQWFFLFPGKIYTYNAKFREILTYGYGFSGYGVTNDSANTFLENLVSISVIDDYLNSTNPTSLVNNVELEKSKN